MYRFIDNLKSDRTFFFYRGSTAFYALLRAIDIQPGDEVILQVFTCDSVPGTIVKAGGQPVYVDINPLTFNMDPAKIEEKITPRTKVILAQHTYGIPAEMDWIMHIARKHNLWVIEDSCHALGSKYRGQEAGSIGDAAFYSFGWHKPLVLGVGGAATVNNPDLRQAVARIYPRFSTPPQKELAPLYAQYLAYSLFMTPSLFWTMRKWYRKLMGKGIISGTARRKKGATPQSNQPATPSTAAPDANLGRRIIPFQERRLFGKLKGFERAAAHQAWIISEYEQFLPGLGYPPLELGDGFEPVFFKYPLLSTRKKEIFEKAPQAGIELSYIFASPLYPHQPKMAARWRSFGYRQGMCPISEDIADRIVALPVHTKIQGRDIEKIMAFLASFQ